MLGGRSVNRKSANRERKRRETKFTNVLQPVSARGPTGKKKTASRKKSETASKCGTRKTSQWLNRVVPNPKQEKTGGLTAGEIAERGGGKKKKIAIRRGEA